MTSSGLTAATITQGDRHSTAAPEACVTAMLAPQGAAPHAAEGARDRAGDRRAAWRQPARHAPELAGLTLDELRA